MNLPVKHRAFLAIPLIGLLWLAPGGSAVASEALSKVNTGRDLHAQKCAACHDAKVATGDGSAIYTRADRKVQSLQRLATQVATCSTELRLDLFPEDEAVIVAYLNQQFYKFK